MKLKKNCNVKRVIFIPLKITYFETGSKNTLKHLSHFGISLKITSRKKSDSSNRSHSRITISTFSLLSNGPTHEGCFSGPNKYLSQGETLLHDNANPTQRTFVSRAAAAIRYENSTCSCLIIRMYDKMRMQLINLSKTWQI